MDAESVYRNLDDYFVRITAIDDDKDAWVVEFELKNKDAEGGGPRYIIDARPVSYEPAFSF